MDFVSTYKTNRLLQGDVIYALYEDLHHNIWVGTSQGLKQLNPQTQKVRKYTISDGLPSNSISAIEGDANGNLWISTNFGISRFNPSTQTFVNFYASEVCKEMNSAKEYHLPAPKEKLSLEAPAVLLTLTPEK